MRIGVTCGFGSLNNSASERVLGLLEPVKLTVWKVMIDRVAAVKFRMNSGGCNDAGCFALESKVFVKNKAEVASGVGCSERRVVYLRKLLFKSNKKCDVLRLDVEYC